MIIFLVGASVVRTTPNNPHVSAMAGNGCWLPENNQLRH
jgi:hypothetical protein